MLLPGQSVGPCSVNATFFTKPQTGPPGLRRNPVLYVSRQSLTRGRAFGGRVIPQASANESHAVHLPQLLNGARSPVLVRKQKVLQTPDPR